jgi:WhiB family transcriptional regulator, redox-sensing transcriptional regulator
VPPDGGIRNVTDSSQFVPVRHAGAPQTHLQELPVSSFPRPSLTLLPDWAAGLEPSTPEWPAPGAADEAWRLDALCAETDPEAFFPEKGGSTREAKRVCTGCAVRAECLEFALANDERFGIWGGLSERERRRLRLQRRDPLSA